MESIKKLKVKNIDKISSKSINKSTSRYQDYSNYKED